MKNNVTVNEVLNLYANAQMDYLTRMHGNREKWTREGKLDAYKQVLLDCFGVSEDSINEVRKNVIKTFYDLRDAEITANRKKNEYEIAAAKAAELRDKIKTATYIVVN